MHKNPLSDINENATFLFQSFKTAATLAEAENSRNSEISLLKHWGLKKVFAHAETHEHPAFTSASSLIKKHVHVYARTRAENPEGFN